MARKINIVWSEMFQGKPQPVLQTRPDSMLSLEPKPESGEFVVLYFLGERKDGRERTVSMALDLDTAVEVKQAIDDALVEAARKG